MARQAGSGNVFYWATVCTGTWKDSFDREAHATPLSQSRRWHTNARQSCNPLATTSDCNLIGTNDKTKQTNGCGVIEIDGQHNAVSQSTLLPVRIL
jgi:hypothetical protein